MNINYIYDGTFEGLLTCVYHAFYAPIKPVDMVCKKEFVENFLVEKSFIESDFEKFQSVYDAIEEKISYPSLKRIFYAYLSEIPGREISILKYLQIGFKLGKDVDLNLANEHVLNIEKMSKLVSKERHRMTGLIRFKRIKENLLYTEIEPDHNIVSLLASHFVDRLRHENFIIHDIKREVGVIYNKKEWILKDLNRMDFSIGDSEEVYEDLWKAYFKAISIKGKENPKLQRRNMPARYWKHLTEKS